VKEDRRRRDPDTAVFSAVYRLEREKSFLSHFYSYLVSFVVASNKGGLGLLGLSESLCNVFCTPSF
jgi:hypothetical protein